MVKLCKRGIFVAVFHRILDFKPGLYFYTGPFFCLFPINNILQDFDLKLSEMSCICILNVLAPFKHAYLVKYLIVIIGFFI
jgi:hypothetical protein